MINSWSLNIVGLVLSTAGGFLMYFRPPVHEPKNFLDPQWIASQTESGWKALNSNRQAARLGVLLLSLGLGFQLAAALIDRFLERAA